MSVRCTAMFLGALAVATSVFAQGSSVTLTGPPPPVPPAVINRDALGHATVRATRLTTPLKIDGRLDEEVYGQVPSMTDFIQNDPAEGEPATQKTEVWVFFDSDTIYIVGKCWESRMDRMIATEMRRDGAIGQNDNFAWSFDTFYDHRNGVLFEVSPLGGRTDGQVTNERSVNTNWNPVWRLEVGRFEGGWTVEAALPFKSLRYLPGRTQVWGFQARRKNLWKNEISYLTPIPREVLGQGHFRSSLHATLVGLEIDSGSKNLELKPYATSDVTSDTSVRPVIENDVGSEFGVDAKYGVTQNLTADFTYNTDFAQVEADEQQVNLTRFNLFFPEKREFFLENQGTFSFGGTTDANTPVVFHSRTIGLYQGRQIPIIAGGRLSGRSGPFELGLLDIQTDDDQTVNLDSTNFLVGRVKRDILRKSSIGAIFTGRSASLRGSDASQSFGADTTLAFFNNLVIDGYYAKTSEGSPGDSDSYRGRLDYTGDRYGALIERLDVGKTFNPEVGFVRRTDMRRNFGQFRFSPRPKASTIVRKYSWIGSIDYIENGAGQLETRTTQGSFGTDFNSSDAMSVNYTDYYEFLPAPLRLAPDVVVPVGSYDYAAVEGSYTFGPQRPLAAGTASFQYGTFYDGHKTTFAISRARSNAPPHLSVEPGYSLNVIDLPQGSFTTHLVSTRVTYMATPLMFTSALVQYNSLNHTLSANIRFRWEYQPGSELFVVYNDQRDALSPGYPELINRAFIVKINRLFRF